jgi:hypothetical protein
VPWCCYAVGPGRGAADVFLFQMVVVFRGKTGRRRRGREGGRTEEEEEEEEERSGGEEKEAPGAKGRGKTAGLRGAGWGKGGSGQPTTPITPPRPSSQGPKSAQLPFWIFVARAVGSSPIAPQ